MHALQKWLRLTDMKVAFIRNAARKNSLECNDLVFQIYDKWVCISVNANEVRY